MMAEKRRKAAAKEMELQAMRARIASEMEATMDTGPRR